MTIATDSDLAVQTRVGEELEWSPDVDASSVAIAVERGIVALFGEVATSAERLAATRAAGRTRGVRTVVNHLRVHPTRAPAPELARIVSRCLAAASNVPTSVTAEVRGRSVRLSGEVDWDFQRHAAVRTTQYLRGVEVVENCITLRPRASLAADAGEAIMDALTRTSALDPRHLEVIVSGDTVTLTGIVRSLLEREAAAAVAWRSSAVARVDNRIVVLAE